MAPSTSQMREAIIRNLPEKTGKDLNEWIKIAQSIKAGSEGELLNTLKSEFLLGHFQAQTIIKCLKDI